MSRPIPHDADAERLVIGACLMRRDIIGTVTQIVTPEDFIGAERRATFSAIVDLWSAGEPVDSHTVSRTQKGGLGDNDLLSCISAVPALGHAEKYARTIVEHAARRRLIDLATTVQQSAYDLEDPADIIDGHRSALEHVDLPIGRLPKDLAPLDDLLDAPIDQRAPWVVPGLLRSDWRVIVVAPEGAGKTLLLQQVAVCASQGVHPLTYVPIPPVRVLMIDLENPEERIVQGCAPLRDLVRMRVKDYDPRRLVLWHRPGGIDLRTRATVAELEASLTSVRPQLVVMGPSYKASTRAKGEGWDEGAAAVQRVLDGLRTRFGFALLMEDHAPQANNGARDLRPFGSSLWLRWPEIGLKLKPEKDERDRRKLMLRRWRGDRLPNSWPDSLIESTPWPWEGHWPHGIDNERSVA